MNSDTWYSAMVRLIVVGDATSPQHDMRPLSELDSEPTELDEAGQAIRFDSPLDPRASRPTHTGI